VKASKFMSFLLTEQGIKANLKKSVTIINMWSPIIIKDMQKLIGHMTTLSHFILRRGAKGFSYF